MSVVCVYLRTKRYSDKDDFTLRIAAKYVAVGLPNLVLVSGTMSLLCVCGKSNICLIKQSLALALCHCRFYAKIGKENPTSFPYYASTARRSSSSDNNNMHHYFIYWLSSRIIFLFFS